MINDSKCLNTDYYYYFLLQLLIIFRFKMNDQFMIIDNKI